MIMKGHSAMRWGVSECGFPIRTDKGSRRQRINERGLNNTGRPKVGDRGTKGDRYCGIILYRKWIVQLNKQSINYSFTRTLHISTGIFLRSRGGLGQFRLWWDLVVAARYPAHRYLPHEAHIRCRSSASTLRTPTIAIHALGVSPPPLTRSPAK